MEGCLTIKVWPAGWRGKTCGSFGFLNLVLYLGCIGRRSSDLLFLFLLLSLSLDGTDMGIGYIGMDMGGRGGGKRTPVSFLAFVWQAFLGTGQRGGGGYITWERDRQDMRLERGQHNWGPQAVTLPPPVICPLGLIMSLVFLMMMTGFGGRDKGSGEFNA